MPSGGVDIEELKASLATAKKRTMNFAICLGKTAETTVFMIHKTRAPDALARLAKAAGETQKIASGYIDVEGSKIQLRCIDGVPSGIAKRTRAFLAGHKMAFKVYALDPEGKMVEGGEDDEAQPPGTGTETSETTAAPQGNVEWSKIATILGPRIEAYVVSGGEKAAAVTAAWQGANAAAAKGNLDDAKAVVARILPLLGEPSKAVASEQSATDHPSTGEPVTTEEDSVSPPIEEGRAENVEDISVGGKEGVDTAVYAQAAKTWRDARKTMLTEIGKLQSAIVALLSPDPRMAEIVADAADLPDRLDILDTGLDEVLDALADAADETESLVLRNEARSQLRECAAALESKFFKDVDSSNGFASVAVTATARKSLAAIARVLT